MVCEGDYFSSLLLHPSKSFHNKRKSLFHRILIIFIACISIQAGMLSVVHAQIPANTLTVEAEWYSRVVNKGGKSWNARTLRNASGQSVLFVGPNTGVNKNANYLTRSPRVDYLLTFPKAGLYYIWIRGIGASGADDSVHIGLDGQAVSTSSRISRFGPTLTWSNRTMDQKRAMLYVPSAGPHRVNVWMREDGFVFDKIVLTTERRYTPTRQGPTTTPTSSTTGPKPTTQTTNTGSVTGISKPKPTTLPSSALLSWQAPTSNADGTAIKDLAGFVVYMANTAGPFRTSDIIAKVPAFSPSGGSTQKYTVQGLKVGTYYFSVTAYNNAGGESSFSDVVSKKILR